MNASRQNVTATDSEGIYADADNELRGYCLTLYNSAGSTCMASVSGQVYFESGTANLRTSDALPVLVTLPPSAFTQVCFPWEWSDDSNRIGDVEQWRLPLGAAVTSQAPSSCWDSVRLAYYGSQTYGTENGTALWGDNGTQYPADACLVVNPDIGQPVVITPVGEYFPEVINADSFFFQAVAPWNADIDWWQSVRFDIYDSSVNHVCRLSTTANLKGGASGFGGDRQIFQARYMADQAYGYDCQPLGIGEYTAYAVAYDGDGIPSEVSEPVAFEVTMSFDADAIIADWCVDEGTWVGDVKCAVASLFKLVFIPSESSFQYLAASISDSENSASRKLTDKMLPSSWDEYVPDDTRRSVGGIDMPSEADLTDGVSAWFTSDEFVNDALVAFVWIAAYSALLAVLLSVV